MRVLVTGSRGMMGTDLVQILSRDNVVIGLDIKELDITDQERTLDIILNHNPDVVINCAAYTDVDGCEINREYAYKVNAVGPKNLATACNDCGAILVHISTDYVFSGKSTVPYKEVDPTGPHSVYGASKLEGENYIRTLCDRHYIVRTSWLFGIHGGNFVKTILRLAKENKVLTIVNDQTGSPTFTEDLAVAIKELMAIESYGIYHLTNSGACTWYEFAREILAEAGVTDIEVKPITSEQLKRPASRPVYSVLDNFKWCSKGFEPLRHYRDALKDYLAITKKG